MERREYRREHLIDSIYDAGASPERWPGILSSVASEAGAVGAVMFGFSRSQGLVFEHNGSLDHTSSQVFKTRHRNNAWVVGMSERPANCLVRSDEIQTLRDLKRTAFHDEVLRPQKIAHAALCTLKFDADVDIQFSVHRGSSEGDFRSHELATLRRLLPHLRRALGVSLRLSLSQGRHAHSLPNTIVHRMSCAAFTLSARGELLDINPAAERLIARGGACLLYRHALRFENPAEQLRWRAGLERVLAGAPLCSLLATHDGHRIELVLAALRASESHGLNARSRGRAAVLVLARPLPALSRDDALTPAEWRVAQLAAGGGSSLQIARALELSLNTVKTHMRRIYQKLHVHRQGELMLLLNRNPAAPD